MFTIRRYDSLVDLKHVLGVKQNGKAQPETYVNNIVEEILGCAGTHMSLFPMYHFNTRKAIEMWPKEVYRAQELYPLDKNLKMGPVSGVSGPHAPVLLLKRAFGFDCFECYFQSEAHKKVNVSSQNSSSNSNKNEFSPILLPGGLWEGGTKLPLKDEHYVPVQPISRKERRPNFWNRTELSRYLEDQIAKEQSWGLLPNASDGNVIYLDGVFDLFHIGHLEAIQQCRSLAGARGRVIIGVTGDKDAEAYKRRPVISQSDRRAIVAAMRDVDEVVCPCPLVVTETFMEHHGIDFVVHGFANDEDAARQSKFFEFPMRMGKFKRIEYSKKATTSDLIRRIAGGNTKKSKPQWFGAAVRDVTLRSYGLPKYPFPPDLNRVVEEHVAKADSRRSAALAAIRVATGAQNFDELLVDFKSSSLSEEGRFSFKPEEHPLRASFLSSAGLASNFDLSQLHSDPDAKDLVFRRIAENPKQFQATYDEFVRSVCAPRLSTLCGTSKVYYQAFPCIRIIQPGEFSIGPHADVSYGHHPFSINFYVPLTSISGTSSLYLESIPGKKDWHPIEGVYADEVRHFAGGMNLHWTTENMTGKTRVSLDFRIILDKFYHALKCGGSMEGGQKDVYREKEGYYCVALQQEQRVLEAIGREAEVTPCPWIRQGELPHPDSRVGYPFTVDPSKWDKVLRRNKAKRQKAP